MAYIIPENLKGTSFESYLKCGDLLVESSQDLRNIIRSLGKYASPDLVQEIGSIIYKIETARDYSTEQFNRTISNK